MTHRRDVVIALAGAAIIVSALFGLMEIGQRAGPYERALEPAVLDVATQGSHRSTTASGTTGPRGVCIPESPGAPCRTAETTVRLFVNGLPVLPDSMHYPVYLVGAETRRLGLLDDQSGHHELVVEHDGSSQDATALIVTLDADAGASDPGPVVLLTLPLSPGPNGESTDLASQASVQARTGTGNVRANEIGGFTVSATAVATLGDAPPFPSWAYHAWFEPVDPDGPWTYLGIFEPDGDASDLDARIERVRLEDQGRFLVHLAPHETAPPSSPIGFPAYTAALP